MERLGLFGLQNTCFIQLTFVDGAVVVEVQELALQFAIHIIALTQDHLSLQGLFEIAFFGHGRIFGRFAHIFTFVVPFGERTVQLSIGISEFTFGQTTVVVFGKSPILVSSFGFGAVFKKDRELG